MWKGHDVMNIWHVCELYVIYWIWCTCERGMRSWIYDVKIGFYPYYPLLVYYVCLLLEKGVSSTEKCSYCVFWISTELTLCNQHTPCSNLSSDWSFAKKRSWNFGIWKLYNCTALNKSHTHMLSQPLIFCAGTKTHLENCSFTTNYTCSQTESYWIEGYPANIYSV